MNCQEFNQLIVHLTCDVKMDAAERAHARTHADTCRNCGARVTRQQAIARALQSLAEQEQTIQAPERIGQLLFAAFEQQQRPVVRPAPRSVRDSFWAGLRLHWAGAAAAAMILLFAVSSLLWWRVQQPETKVVKVHNGTTAMQKQEPAAQEKPATPVQQARASTITVRAIAKPRVRRTATIMRSEATGNGEFLSLRPGAQSEPTEFEQVVRLQIPRTTLALWGVQLNEDNDNQKVNAEVVFGEDGIARAIRILNNAERSNQ